MGSDKGDDGHDGADTGGLRQRRREQLHEAPRTSFRPPQVQYDLIIQATTAYDALLAGIALA